MCSLGAALINIHTYSQAVSLKRGATVEISVCLCLRGLECTCALLALTNGGWRSAQLSARLRVPSQWAANFPLPLLLEFLSMVFFNKMRSILR